MTPEITEIPVLGLYWKGK